MLERQYQQELKKKIEAMFPGCIIMKNDPVSLPGIPDLTIVYKNHFAFLEVKNAEKASHRPNQAYYIETINSFGGFASFIYPECEGEVLDAMARSFDA